MTAPLEVLALDPGPNKTGWAHLRIDASRGLRTSYVAGAHAPIVVDDLCRLVRETRAVLVAVEGPAGHIFEESRGEMLLATATVAGGMVWAAKVLGCAVEKFTAQQVRKVLCGKANAGDDVVKAVVRGNVFGCPELTNTHVRDAIAVGLYASWVHLGRASRPATATRKAGAKRPAVC